MTSLDTGLNVQPAIPRDGWGRPLITPVGGGKAVAYTRCTTYVKCLDDTTALDKWKQRMVATGLAERPDLLLLIKANRDDKNMLNKLCEQAMEAAGSSAAANTGTALHGLCEQVDAGMDIGSVPGDYRRDLEAYRQATAGLRVLYAETFVVQDELKVGGTPDRIVEYDGTRYIADIKTGGIEYGQGTIAMQLAMYAHSMFYDAANGTRTPLPGVDGERGIVIHLPQGTGTCRLHWIDIARGWRGIALAGQVRQWRSTTRNMTDEFAAAVDVLLDAGLLDTDPITAQIEAAATPDALVALWKQYRTDWTPAHTAAAAQRKTQLIDGR